MCCIASCHARTSDRQCWSGLFCFSLLQGSAEEYLPWRTHPPSFTRLSSGTAKEHQAAPGGTAGFCFSDSFPKTSVGPLPQSSPWQLGAAIPRVRPG